MKILVIGSGGREHALVWKLAQSPQVKAVYCAPGNPGISRLATLVPMGAGDIEGLASFAAKERIDLTVVGPEQPLAEGIVDLFQARGLTVFGPTRRAAELEWSKAFAKAFMERHGIPTAAHRTFAGHTVSQARSYLDMCPLPIVLKADGLAAGKGVIICTSREEIRAALRDITETMVFGDAGRAVVVEEFMTGQEASVFAVCDGKNFVTLAAAQDHKRVFDGDQGKNTGGMGAYAPAPIVTTAVLRFIEERIIRPTLHGMALEERPYAGCLYVGLMLTPEGPKVVEFNARFGDPETQVVVPLYDGDLAELLLSAARGTLESFRPPATSKMYAVCVVLASGGYPGAHKTGLPIDGLDAVDGMDGVVVFHAGTKAQGGGVVTAGGRVLGVTSMKGGSLREAISCAYEAVKRIRFEGMHFRKDIGERALRR